jgi:hypothetical protein
MELIFLVQYSVHISYIISKALKSGFYLYSELQFSDSGMIYIFFFVSNKGDVQGVM